MSLTVMKFGGTSVAAVEKIRNAAKKVIKKSLEGEDVVVVVSAMGKTTDHLARLAGELTERPNTREMDMLLATGEQVTSALMAMALQTMGQPAVSLTGWQAGITTEAFHGNAKIKDIDTRLIQQHLNSGHVVIVAGFQGITDKGEITTLGRGGSDTSAVALASACGASLCEIYTDVTGVFTTDPRYVEEACKLKEISYDEMLEMAYLGAGVLHPRAVEYAKNSQLPLTVRASFSDEEGTFIKEGAAMEKGKSVRGIAFEKNVTKITLLGLPNEIFTLSNVFNILAENKLNVDVIIQNALDESRTNLSFTIENGSLGETLDILDRNKARLQYDDLNIETNLAKVSIVGSGMVSNPGVAAKMFDTLTQHNIKVKMVSTSEIKVSTIIHEKDLPVSLKTLHCAFDLAEKEALTMKPSLG
ncbi:aspartate kinase [Scopulibacillus darangshiensis]|uniref:Aspartokinase n=1 Tax=Scopulibacillus darangshiensis TaxID=442528 RepID=A0A4V2SNQ7_9BACL|nr:aspartate kinase [Scopulibacillus darangshiensis]TCP32136.1 aspartate kinase [Scopulibacillus darangshiensis]